MACRPFATEIPSKSEQVEAAVIGINECPDHVAVEIGGPSGNAAVLVVNAIRDAWTVWIYLRRGSECSYTQINCVIKLSLVVILNRNALNFGSALDVRFVLTQSKSQVR